MSRFENMRPWQQRILTEVFRELECAVSVPEARSILEARSNNSQQLNNPDLQPVLFAVRYATSINYGYGVLAEILAWVTFVVFSLLWLLTVAVLVIVTLVGLFGGQVRAIELITNSLPKLDKKRKRIMHGFERQRWAAQRHRYNAYQKLCADERAPILYLRPFASDRIDELPLNVKRKVDEELVDQYEAYGPIVAVGEPNEKGPVPGPVRLYFNDDTWRAGVIYLMSISQRVIIQAGIAHGVLWELGMARQLLKPERLVISVADAFSPNTLDRFYPDFKRCAEGLLECELPLNLGNCVHIGFSENWEPFPLHHDYLMDTRQDWLAFKHFKRRQTVQNGKETARPAPTPSHVCSYRDKSFFDWFEAEEGTPTCELCGKILKIV